MCYRNGVRKGILEVERPVWDRLSSILKERIEELGVRDSLEPFVRWAGKFFIAENYLEAVGIMTALKEGIALSYVQQFNVGRLTTRLMRAEESPRMDELCLI